MVAEDVLKLCSILRMIGYCKHDFGYLYIFIEKIKIHYISLICVVHKYDIVLVQCSMINLNVQ